VLPHEPAGAPPRVKPAIPVVETRPPVVASPNACASWSTSPHVAPAWTLIVRLARSRPMPRFGERSMTMPQSHVP